MFEMPLACGLGPVRKVARASDHNGVVVNALVKYAPSLAMRSMLGVLTYGCPAALISAQRRSSTSTNTILGCSFFDCYDTAGDS